MYNLFISHSWTYTDAYEKLVNLLDGDPYFCYKNYSVPKYDPIHNAAELSYPGQIKVNVIRESRVIDYAK